MIDPDSLHMRQEAHLNGGAAWFGYTLRCVEYPRLTRKDVYSRKDKSVTSTFRVDGCDCADLADALLRLETPPILTEAERAVLETVSDEPSNRRRDAFIAESREVWHLLREKGFVEWHSGRVNRTEAGRAAVAEMEK